MQYSGRGYLFGVLFAICKQAGAVSTTLLDTAVYLCPQRVFGLALDILTATHRRDLVAEVLEQLSTTAFSNGPLLPSEIVDFQCGYCEEMAKTLPCLAVRMSADLKQWTIEHGGQTLIISLLERERQKTSS